MNWNSNQDKQTPPPNPYAWLRSLNRGDKLLLNGEPVSYVGPIGLRGHLVNDGRFTLHVNRKELKPFPSP